jgi:hypothetical protein
VELIQTTFEAWPANEAPLQLIIAAQSWHWVSPELRFRKAAKVLSFNGSLAVFGHVPVGLPPRLPEQFKEIYLRYAGTGGLRRKLGTSLTAHTKAGLTSPDCLVL